MPKSIDETDTQDQDTDDGLDIRVIAQGADERPIYRRRYRKSDGRDFLLYGYVRPDHPMINDGLDTALGQSELRWHPLRGEWNVYAAARQNRTFKPNAKNDPLAPPRSREDITEIPFADFEIAVFPNRFPSLHTDNPELKNAIAGIPRATARGHCDVVVYTPEQIGSLATLSQDRRILLVQTWIDRYRTLFDQGYDTVLPFENRGEEVGVTLHHPHGQIYAFPFTPPVQAAGVRAFNDGYDLTKCFSAWRSDYLITEQEEFGAFAPPFARFPYETWLIPYRRRSGPWEFDEGEIEGFAALLGDMTRRYDTFFGRVCPYMLSLHAAPISAGSAYHFTAQFYPLLRSRDKVKYLASIEQSTGVFTVDVMPEVAAAALRDV